MSAAHLCQLVNLSLLSWPILQLSESPALQNSTPGLGKEGQQVHLAPGPDLTPLYPWMCSSEKRPGYLLSTSMPHTRSYVILFVMHPTNIVICLLSPLEMKTAKHRQLKQLA